MKRIFIFGSCVSRDAFDFEDHPFKLVGYCARSSFASISSINFECDKSVLENIKSPFQRKMVEFDMDKTFYELFKRECPDLLLIDLIDERFNIIANSMGARATLSSELSGIMVALGDYIFVKNNSEKYFKFFEHGIGAVIAEAREKGVLVRVIKTYWAFKNEKGGDLPKPTASAIQKENVRLEQLYNIVSKYVTETEFISVPAEYCIANAQHKWGEAPFHYTNEFYRFLLSNLNC